jgi:uncharacterized transporter YbjL
MLIERIKRAAPQTDEKVNITKELHMVGYKQALAGGDGFYLVS